MRDVDPSAPRPGSASLKYAHVERERRWLLPALPVATGVRVEQVLQIEDRYLVGTRLRLREVRRDGRPPERKLGHKVRLAQGPAEIACTSLYLDAAGDRLCALEARSLSKDRHVLVVDGAPGRTIVVDVFAGQGRGLVLAEEDRGPPSALPDQLAPLAEVTDDEALTGAALAFADRAQVVAAARRHGLDLDARGGPRWDSENA